jgi:mono/diheme cytochrome c family protein
MPATRTRLILTTAIATLLGTGAVGAVGAFVVVRAGWYDIGATTQHFQPVYSLLEQAMHYSVRHHALGVAAPALGGHGQVLRGAAVYRDNCAQCHGGPGTAPGNHGLSMQPVPGPLVDASRHWKPRELYWITRHGIKMSGMPAWEFHLSEDEMWATVAFVMQLPTLNAADYRTMTAPPGEPAR